MPQLEFLVGPNSVTPADNVTMYAYIRVCDIRIYQQTN